MNQIAVDFIKQHEGCELVAYKDQGDVWTCGWGSTGPDIKDGIIWTQEQADKRLAQDVTKTEVAVLKLLNKRLSDQSIAALISLAYNIGTQGFAGSHTLRCVNSGDNIEASKAILNWDHIGYAEVRGLLIRRLEEAALFLRGI